MFVNVFCDILDVAYIRIRAGHIQNVKCNQDLCGFKEEMEVTKYVFILYLVKLYCDF